MNKRIRRQIRWFSNPGSTSSIARQEFEQLPNHGKAALIEALRRYQRGAERRAEIKRLVNPSGYPALAELRVQVGHAPFPSSSSRTHPCTP